MPSAARLPVPGLVLAGGAGRRMSQDGSGADKALLPLAGRPLLAHLVERLGPQCAALVLNAGGDPGRFDRFDLPIVPDDSEFSGCGPLAGILAGLDFAALAGFDRIAIAPVDTPFLPDDYVARLIAAGADSGAAIVCAESAGDEGRRGAHFACALVPVRLRGPLRAALKDGERRVSAWMRAQGMATAWFDAAPAGRDPFLNINTPENLARAEAALAGQASARSI